MAGDLHVDNAMSPSLPAPAIRPEVAARPLPGARRPSRGRREHRR